MTVGPARCLFVELDEPVPAIDWGLAPLWRIIATTGGVPCGGAWIVSPGRLHDPDLFLEQLLLDAREHADALALTGELKAALGIEPPAAVTQTVSVVVCTHRRSHYLPALLESLAKLSPPPAEVIVVDNDPGDWDCRELILNHGARYVREDRRGLDHARVAGLRAAVGTVVAYTDDDCVAAPRWLARVNEHFADASVDAVTGPAFAYELATPSQLRFELEGGFNRGFTERRFDWMTIAPASSGAVGAGANMMFRRDRLLALGEVFPPELDAGTAAGTGGDLYALYRVLEGGGRVVYDPGSYVFHRHRREPEALSRAFRGYGVGLVAATEKLIVQRRDPEAIAGVRWLWQQYREALLQSWLGQRDKRSLRIAAYYLVGGLTGIGKWPRALRHERARAAAIAPREGTNAATPPAAGHTRSGLIPAASPPVTVTAEKPEPAYDATVSVIIPTIGRPAVLEQCLRALPCPGPSLEIIVVDDRPGPSAPLAAEMPKGVQVVRSGGVGAAAARNLGARHAAGEILIFMDDDLIAGDRLVQRHLDAHDGRTDVFVIGCSLPEPIGNGWAARAAALWWHDHFRSLSQRSRLSPADMLSGNVSIHRERFHQLGGFSEYFGRLRREDWLFGAAVLRAGLEVRFSAEAAARHTFTLTTAGRLRAAAEEGWGDAVLAHQEPEFAAILSHGGASRRARGAAILSGLFARPRVQGAAVAGLDRLERARLRQRWLSTFHRAQTLAYLSGRRRGERSMGQTHTKRSAPEVLRVDPDRPRLDFEGLFAPDLIVDYAGRMHVLSADLGRWTGEHARGAARLIAADRRRRRRAPTPRADVPRIAIVARAADLTEAVVASAAREGVSIHRCHADESLWCRATSVAAAATAEVVWVVMPEAVLSADVATELRSISDGDRVALTVAIPGPTRSLFLQDARLDSGDWLALCDPPVLLGFRPDLLDRIGSLPLVAEAVGGSMAPGLDLARRAMRAGEVLGKAKVTGAQWRYRRLRPWRHPEWHRQRARGSQIVGARNDARTAGMIQAAATILLFGGVPGRPVRSRIVSFGGLAHGGIVGLAAACRGTALTTSRGQPSADPDNRP